MIMLRKAENMETILTTLSSEVMPFESEISGRYEADELGAVMEIEARDGGVYGCTKGILGTGIMERLHPVGQDTWIMATKRSMDAPAPGDWTLSIKRDEAGTITGFQLGCWLARQIDYLKVS